MKDKARGQLTRVSELFAKYKNTLKPPEATVIEAFIEVVADVLGITLTKERIRYNPASKTLAVTGKAALKSEIKLHQQEIIDHLKGRLGAKNAPETIL